MTDYSLSLLLLTLILVVVTINCVSKDGFAAPTTSVGLKSGEPRAAKYISELELTGQELEKLYDPRTFPAHVKAYHEEKKEKKDQSFEDKQVESFNNWRRFTPYNQYDMRDVYNTAKLGDWSSQVMGSGGVYTGKAKTPEQRGVKNIPVYHETWNAALEPEIFEQQKEFVEGRGGVIPTASLDSIRDDPNYVNPVIGLRRPDYNVDIADTDRVVPSELGPEQMVAPMINCLGI